MTKKHPNTLEEWLSGGVITAHTEGAIAVAALAGMFVVSSNMSAKAEAGAVQQPIVIHAGEAKTEQQIQNEIEVFFDDLQKQDSGVWMLERLSSGNYVSGVVFDMKPTDDQVSQAAQFLGNKIAEKEEPAEAKPVLDGDSNSPPPKAAKAVTGYKPAAETKHLETAMTQGKDGRWYLVAVEVDNELGRQIDEATQQIQKARTTPAQHVIVQETIAVDGQPPIQLLSDTDDLCRWLHKFGYLRLDYIREQNRHEERMFSLKTGRMESLGYLNLRQQQNRRRDSGEYYPSGRDPMPAPNSNGNGNQDSTLVTVSKLRKGEDIRNNLTGRNGRRGVVNGNVLRPRNQDKDVTIGKVDWNASSSKVKGIPTAAPVVRTGGSGKITQVLSGSGSRGDSGKSTSTRVSTGAAVGTARPVQQTTSRVTPAYPGSNRQPTGTSAREVQKVKKSLPRRQVGGSTRIGSSVGGAPRLGSGSRVGSSGGQGPRFGGARSGLGSGSRAGSSAMRTPSMPRSAGARVGAPRRVGHTGPKLGGGGRKGR